MDAHTAWLYAASWGSYMHSGDPGACLYGFDENFKVQSEQHRADCIAQMESNREYVVDHPDDYEPNEADMIDELLIALREAEVAP